jgi:hypothetical protein
MKMKPMSEAPRKKKMILVYVYWIDRDGEEGGGYFEAVHWHKKDKKWTSGPSNYDTNDLVGWWPMPKRPKVKRPNGKFERLEG